MYCNVYLSFQLAAAATDRTFLFTDRRAPNSGPYLMAKLNLVIVLKSWHNYHFNARDCLAVIEDGFPDYRSASSLPLSPGLTYGSSKIRSRPALAVKGVTAETPNITSGEGRQFLE